MKTFDQLIELFAISHKDFAHKPAAKQAKDKSFYRVAAIDEQSEFIRNHNTAHSPCIAYSNLADEEINDGTMSSNITVWLLAKTKASTSKTQRQDDNASFDTRAQLNEYAQELVTWLNVYKQKHPNDPSLRGLATHKKITIGGMPVMYEGWWVVGLQFEHLTKVSNCLVDSHYFNVDESTLEIVED